MTSTTAEYADKITALLAKATDPASTPAEAEAYTAKAEKLMVKWGISDALLDEKNRKQKKGREKIVEEKIYIKGTEGRGLLQVGFAVTRGLGIKGLQSSGRGSMDKVLYLIGFESDVKRAKTLYESLVLQALAARADWWAGYEEKKAMDGNQKFLAKRQFIWSFASAVQKRLTETRQEAETEVTGTGTELVLVDRSKQVEDWVSQNYKVGKGRGATSGSLHGHAEGRAAGVRARLGGSQLGSAAGGAIDA